MIIDVPPLGVSDHLLAWLAKVVAALTGVATAAALLFKAVRKVKEVIDVAGRFVKAVDALELLAVEQARINTTVSMVVALADQPFWRADPHGYCTFANAAYQDLTGRSIEELRGIGWKQVIHREQREQVMHDWQSAAESGQEYAVEFNLVHPRDGVIPVRAKGFPVKDGRGQVVEYIGTTIRLPKLST